MTLIKRWPKKERTQYHYINLGKRERKRSGRCLVMRYNTKRTMWVPLLTLNLN